MKKLHFDYSMQIDYSEDVSTCNYTIKCVPQITARQIPHDIEIALVPPSRYNLGYDGLKNRQLYGKNAQPHKMFNFRISGNVDVGLSDYEEVEDSNLSMVFKHPHGLVIPGPSIKGYYDSLEIDKNSDAYSLAVNVMKRLHEDFCYKPNTTTLDTTAESAFQQGHGVCQDFAHIYITLMHLSGLPARYVVGLIVGEGASHAWVEVLINGKWYGFDPTNNKKVFDEHIKLGVGRDASDCMINRGIMHGGGLHTQTINVKVIEIE